METMMMQGRAARVIMAVAAMMGAHNNVKMNEAPAQAITPKPRYNKIVAINPAQLAWRRKVSGRPRKQKNRANCARLAKTNRRRA